MKSDSTKEQPAFNLLKNDGVQAQVDNKVITKVLMQNGQEFDIEPGSFKFFITAGDRPQPYVQFKSYLWTSDDQNLDEKILHTLEVFPASVAGVAFLAAEEDTDNG